MKKHALGPVLAGIGAGAVNGLLGAGGGMILVPLLGWLSDLEEQEIFPASVCIIAPICIVTLAITWRPDTTPWNIVLSYLLGSVAGGIGAGFLGRKIPTLWLHRALGLLILWGGVRYLC